MLTFQIKMANVLISLIKRPAVCSIHQFGKGVSFGSLQKQVIVFNNVNVHKIMCQQRVYSVRSEKQQDKSLQQQTNSDISGDVQQGTFKTVKETTKTASYMGVILLGVGVTGFLFYTVFSELFSNKSPNNVYSKALDRVCSDTRVQDALGEPISGYGEENRRGRRQHVSHLLYEKDAERRLRMKFYISGSRKRATVHLEMKEDDSGKYIYRYLFVELDDFGRHPIIFEDNRSVQSNPLSSSDPKPLPELDLSEPLNMNLNFPDAALK